MVMRGINFSSDDPRGQSFRRTPQFQVLADGASAEVKPNLDYLHSISGSKKLPEICEVESISKAIVEGEDLLGGFNIAELRKMPPDLFFGVAIAKGDAAMVQDYIKLHGCGLKSQDYERFIRLATHIREQITTNLPDTITAALKGAQKVREKNISKDSAENTHEEREFIPLNLNEDEVRQSANIVKIIAGIDGIITVLQESLAQALEPLQGSGY